MEHEILVYIRHKFLIPSLLYIVSKSARRAGNCTKFIQEFFKYFLSACIPCGSHRLNVRINILSLMLPNWTVFLAFVLSRGSWFLEAKVSFVMVWLGVPCLCPSCLRKWKQSYFCLTSKTLQVHIVVINEHTYISIASNNCSWCACSVVHRTTTCCLRWFNIISLPCCKGNDFRLFPSDYDGPEDAISHKHLWTVHAGARNAACV